MLSHKFVPSLMIRGGVKQPVVLNVVKGFLVFLEGYPFL